MRSLGIVIAGLAAAVFTLAAPVDAGTRAVHALVTWHGRSHVVVTADGRNWRDVTPRHLAGAIESVRFVDAVHGWVVSGDCAAAKSTLARTNDGGRSWARRAFFPTSCAAGAG